MKCTGREVKMSDKTVHSWKAGPEDEKLLKDLERAKVETSESARVQAGLVLLAKKHHRKIPAA